MKRTFPPSALAALVVGIGIVNAAAHYWHLYYFVWWLDIPMHVLGGTWLAFVFLALLATHPKLPIARMRIAGRYASLFVFVLTVALLWEFFEWSVDRMNGLIHLDALDTVADIMNGLLGAALGAAFFRLRGYNQPT